MTIPGFENCCEIFRDAEKQHSDLMEPYVNRLADVADDAEQTVKIMREGLAATFRQRYPMPPGVDWPGPMEPRAPETKQIEAASEA